MTNCTHRNIQAWEYEDGPADFWSCVDCRLRFAPITKEMELGAELVSAREAAQEVARIRDMLSVQCAQLTARVAELEKDAGRWKFAWENDLMLHQWDGMWWCTRTDCYRNKHEYPKAATREAAIDAAMEAK